MLIGTIDGDSTTEILGYVKHMEKDRKYGIIGDVVTALHEGKNLKTIRNCGAKSVEEIMEKLFMMQYNALDDNEQEEYLRTIVKMNKGNSSILSSSKL